MNFKRKSIILSAIFLLSSSFISAQEINWSNLSFGGIVQYSITNSDFEEYWGNFPSAGFAAEYAFSDNFSFETSLSASYLKSLTISNSIPNFVLINIPGGFKYYFLAIDEFKFNVFTGLTSSTFVFTGTAAESLGDNFIESEFGVFASIGNSLFIYKKMNLEIFISGQSIFTAPESILFYNLGMKIFWK